MSNQSNINYIEALLRGRREKRCLVEDDGSCVFCDGTLKVVDLKGQTAWEAVTVPCDHEGGPRVECVGMSDSMRRVMGTKGEYRHVRDVSEWPDEAVRGLIEFGVLPALGFTSTFSLYALGNALIAALEDACE